jgi:hypothetical protein
MSESGQAQVGAAVGTVIETVESQEFQSQFVTPLLNAMAFLPEPPVWVSAMR